MAITYSTRTYGPQPWHHLQYGTNGAAGNLPAFVYVPGGGFNLRDPIVVTDPTFAGATSPIAGALANAGSALNETYRIFVLNVASAQHNLSSILNLTSWNSGGTAYALDDQVLHSGKAWRCTSAHTSNATKEPGQAGGIREWSEIESNDIGRPRIANRGDGTPAYGATAVTDIQRAIGWIRQNASALGVDPDKILTMGSSAGAYSLAVANMLDELPFAAESHPGMHHPHHARGFSRANAQILEICPARFELYVTTDFGSDQALFRTFMQLLHGDEDLSTFAAWSTLDIERKKCLDPYHVGTRTTRGIPTYLNYPDTKYDDRTPTVVYNGDGAGLGPEVHHAYNGWVLFERFVTPALSGGWGQDGKTVLLMADDTPGQYRRYTDYNASGGTAGVEYQVQTWGSFAQQSGEDIINWANSVL